MATSGSNSTSVTNGKRVLKMTWTLKSQSTTNNTSTINVKAVWSVADTYGISSGSAQTVTVNCLGTTSTGSASATISSGASKTIFDKDITVTHNSDGTKSGTITLNWNPSITLNSGTTIGNLKVSCNVTLPSIPRASTFSVSGSQTIGSSITINITRAVSSWTHTVQVSFNGGSYSNIATGVGTSTTYTLPSSWASSMTSNTAPYKIKVITYNGSTKIGEKINSYTVSLSNSYAPTINSVSITEGNSAVTTGSFVQNLSKLKITVSASGKNGATITSYTYKLNETTYTSGTSNSITTNTITLVGTVTVQVVVTDNKGLSSTYSTNITVVGQGDITISNLTVKRSNSSGYADDNGSYFSISCSLSSTYSMTVYVEYKLSSSSSWSSTYLGSAGTSYTYSNRCPSVDIGTLYSYDVRLKVTTSYATKYSGIKSVPPSYVIMDFKSDGKGLCFGSTCTQAGVEIKGQHFNLTNGNFTITGGNMNTLKVNVKEGGAIYMDRVSSGGETILQFNSCGNEGRSMKLYGGNSSSNTQFGLFDSTNSRYVWKYHNSNKLYIGSSIYMETQGSDTIQSITGITNSGEAGHLVYNNITDKIVYIGMPNLSGNAHETRVRGSSIRLYNHSGGGVYLGSSGSTAVTSDRNLKKNIEELDDRYIKFFNMLTPTTYIYKENGHRKHVGFIAQDVENALDKCGLTTEEFAGLVKETNVDIGDEDNLIHYDELYSLRYEEFIALNTKVIQILLSRIEDLETKVFENK